MALLNPYLHFDGNCEEAFQLYKSVFGGDFESLSRFKDTPQGPPFEKEEENNIMHVSLRVGPTSLLMGSDRPCTAGKGTVGDNVTVSISVDSEAEADRVFNALKEGGKVFMPMDKTFWGAYFGMLTDRVGVNWMVSYELNSQA